MVASRATTSPRARSQPSGDLARFTVTLRGGRARVAVALASARPSRGSGRSTKSRLLLMPIPSRRIRYWRTCHVGKYVGRRNNHTG